MPDSSFLENYPLYRKFKLTFPLHPFSYDKIPTPSIHMYCPNCKSEQTFNMINKYSDSFPPASPRVALIPIISVNILVKYLCAGCKISTRYFLLKFGGNNDNGNVMKTGQYPPWQISMDKNLSKMLGKHSDNYKKALVCESQGYGIGAYAYYRRIIEEIIDDLLDSIEILLNSTEKLKYKEALLETKKTIVAKDKIELVKDLLPESLRPDGYNPLTTLHCILSEGLHGKSDDECLDIAENIRLILIFLVNQIIKHRDSSKNFTESMKKLLEKKSKKS